MLLVFRFADNIFFVSSGSPRSLKTPFQNDARRFSLAFIWRDDSGKVH